MCLVTTDATIKMAKRNMIVYKLGRIHLDGKYFVSEIQEYTYVLGELNMCRISNPSKYGDFYDQKCIDYYDFKDNLILSKNEINNTENYNRFCLKERTQKPIYLSIPTMLIFKTVIFIMIRKIRIK